MPVTRRSKLCLVLSRKPTVRPRRSAGIGGIAVVAVRSSPTGLSTVMRDMLVSCLSGERRGTGPSPVPLRRIVPHMLILALDVGTSSARARVFDAAGRARPGAEGQVTYEPPTTPDGGRELDADRLLAAVTSPADACPAGCGARVSEIAAGGAPLFWPPLRPLP